MPKQLYLKDKANNRKHNHYKKGFVVYLIKGYGKHVARRRRRMNLQTHLPANSRRRCSISCPKWPPDQPVQVLEHLLLLVNKQSYGQILTFLDFFLRTKQVYQNFIIIKYLFRFSISRLTSNSFWIIKTLIHIFN